MKKLFLLLFILLLSAPAFAYNANKPFTHFAENQDLKDALSAFARVQDLNSSFTSEVKGNLSGRFDSISSKDFLEAMRIAFGVEYYLQGNSINFYNEKEKEKSFISVKAMEAEKVLSLLRQSGLISPNLPLTIMKDSNTIMVSGPSLYISQINVAVHAFEDAQMSNQTMRVFPLKYAWAQDITVSSMNSEITIPGIASILQAMVTGRPVTTQVTQLPSSAQAVPNVNEQASPLAALGLSTQSQNTASQESQPQNAPQLPVSIIADPRVNAVLITDAAYRMDYYEEIIADLDKPVQLVEIHAAIVDINSDFNRDMGIHLQANVTDGDFNHTGGIGQALSSITDGLSFSTIYRNGLDTFLAQVELLESQNEGRVLGKPSVLTMDNIQATLENTSTYYIQLVGTEAVDLFRIDAGTVLKVTPHIIYDEETDISSIKLVVHVQDNQGDAGSTATVGALPPIKQTVINTQAIVQEGQSLLIGGYYYEQAQNVKSGIPFLKDIPFLGALFTQTTVKTQQMERLIMITPRIIDYTTDYQSPESVNSPEFDRLTKPEDYATPIPELSPRPGCSKSPSPTS